MTDITELIQQAAASLSHENPFIAEESFNLYDSMSALDLMEPKMDGCEIAMSYYANKQGVTLGRNDEVIDGSTNNYQESQDENTHATTQSEKEPVVTIPPRPVPSSIQSSSLPWKNEGAVDNGNKNERVPLTLRSARVILVEMLVCLESFLAGNSVAESVYTCIYAHESILQDMHRLVHEYEFSDNFGDTQLLQKTLYVSTLVLLKLAETIRSLVQRADIYEEEDFTLNAYHFQFGASVGQMGQDPELILFQAKEVKALLMNNSFTAESESETNGHHSKIDLDVIVYSLDYMANLLEACVILSSLTADNVVNQAQALRDAIASNAQNMEQLMLILDSQSASEEGIYTVQDERVIFSAFDPYINRHLFGNTPVRQVIFSTPIRAVRHLHKIYNELDSGLCTILLRGNSLARLRRILSNISSSSKQLNILSRSLIIINLYFDNMLLGQYPLSSIIANDMHQNAVPQTISTTQYGSQFLERLSKPVYDLLKLYVLNRNRQTHYLDVVMLLDWNKLQEEAATVDICFQREFGLEGTVGSIVYVSNYILATTIRLMEEHVGLGIELEIFNGPYHLLTAFWYRDFLLSTRLNVITGMRQQLKARKDMEETIRLEEIALLQKQVKKPSGGKKKKGKKNAKKIGQSSADEASTTINEQQALQIVIEDDEDTIEFLLLTAKRTLCRGIVRFLAALYQAQVLSKPQYKFTSHEMCFLKRFETFNQIRQPPLLTHDDFLKGCDFGSISSTVLIASAAECFTTARSLLEEIRNKSRNVDELYCSVNKEDATNLIKICVGNSLFLMKLSQSIARQDTDSLSASLDFLDNQFCSIKL